MKKSLVLAIIGLAAGLATSSYGQGAIKLDNYNTYGPNVNYGAGSDGTVGTGVNGNYTMGLYYWNAAGNFTGSVGADPSGIALPGALNANFILGTGVGSTAQFFTTSANTFGQALAGSAFNIPGSISTGGQTWTLMIVAYEGASYTAATYRGHSDAFTLITSDSSAPATIRTGTAMPSFSVFQVVPEPTTMALAGLGGLSLLFFRRKKA